MNGEEEDDEQAAAAQQSKKAKRKKPKQARKVTSEAWEHFDVTDDGPECKHCGHTFCATTSTGNLMKHVKHKHNDKYQVRKTNRFSREEADARVARLISNRCLPMSLVDDEDFIELLSYLNNAYKPPKRKRLTKALLPAMKKRLASAMATKLEIIRHLSLTLDAWTSAANRSYIAVTVHGVSTDWVLESFVLDVIPVKVSETSEFLAEVVREVILAWEIDIERIIAVTSDGAANMRAAVTKCLKIEWIHCVAHLINRSIRLALESDEVKPILSAAKSISKTFKASPSAKRMLVEKQKALGLSVKSLKIDNKTRWGSAYTMFERLVSSRPAVSACLGALHGLRKPVPPDLTSAQWSLVEQLATVLEPLNDSTEILSYQRLPTLGAGMPIVSRAIHHHLKVDDEDDPIVATFKDDISLDLTRQWNILNGQASETLLLAVYLDPRFKTFYFIEDRRARDDRVDKAAEKIAALVQSNANRAVRALRPASGAYANKIERALGPDAIGALPPAADKTDDQAAELEAYRRKPVVPSFLPQTDPNMSPKMFDPLLWWKQRETKYPSLAPLARRYLSITATSVPSERVFSKSGWIVNKRRCTLSDEHVSLLVFLSCNKCHQAS
ncbi:hAT family C-terminal dimerization region domain containing protein [Pandoravirus neocaledonia]|uniref:HAT family C-terminal dimerization region domain containing protein n=1 Tax=Pandoravirus neocaledonia TaxID=2107708 RepID=A0A2U7UBM0_9VIRU|nr:hAT family C-terminal dimerization region domain containing protein [Pandoravirus neocaledonia]AVK75720.1 hAT family C-terminal dimerization region domain containing protein [Pandoravirus neocaledonia]